MGTISNTQLQIPQHCQQLDPRFPFSDVMSLVIS